MRSYAILVLLMVLSAFAADYVFASAWTQTRGNGQIIVSSSFYSASQYYDLRRHVKRQPDYDQESLNPYLEYGLRDDVTLGANLLFQRAHQDAGPLLRAQTNWGVGDSELFIRKRLWQGSGFSFAVEPLVKLPSLSASPGDLPLIGNPHADIALGLSAGYGFSNHFVGLDAQYRHRLGRQKDQIRLSASGGYALSDRWTLMPQAFLTYRTGHASAVNFTESSADDYNLIRLQMTAVYKLSDTTSVQFGGFDDIDGKNTGYGKGVLLALWKRF